MTFQEMIDVLKQGIFRVGLVNPPVVVDPFQALLYKNFMEGKVWLEEFGFALTWDPLAANGSGVTSEATIDPGIDFLLLQVNFNAYPTTGVQTTPQQSPNMLLQLSEKSGAANFNDQAQHVGLWTGQYRDGGGQSGRLVFPRYIRGNNTVQGSLTDLGGTATRCECSLRGIRITYNSTSRSAMFGVTE